MKVLGATVLVLLCTVALCSCERDRTQGLQRTHVVSTCCFSYTSNKIPHKLVVDYFQTSGQCSKPGIVFLTRKGKHICANPSDAWVQEYISILEKNPPVDQ